MTLHHPSDATLVAYAAGSTIEGIALVVASHLAFCGDCRKAVAEAEAIGGGLLDDLAPAPLADAARRRVLSRLDAAEATSAAATREDAALPAPLVRYVESRTGRGVGSLKWRAMWPGIRQIDLKPRRGTGESLRLLRIAPGSAMPLHGHNGTEMTLVLEGSFADESGRFIRGDVAELDEAVQHRPLVDGSDECVCLIATDAPLRFGGGLLGRIVQRVVGI